MTLMLEAGGAASVRDGPGGRRDSKTTLEISAQVQNRVSRKHAHAVFDRLLTGAGSAVITVQL